MKKSTGTSPGALVGGVIGHELGAGPLILSGPGVKFRQSGVNAPENLAIAIRPMSYKNQLRLPDLPHRASSTSEDRSGRRKVARALLRRRPAERLAKQFEKADFHQIRI
ncbi:MAG: hypothetical protein ACYTFA_16830, partial [Planctomycetota bacterium]